MVVVMFGVMLVAFVVIIVEVVMFDVYRIKDS